MTKLVCYFCSKSAKAALEAAEKAGWEKPLYLETVELPCSGGIEAAELLRAFSNGAQAVMVIGCLEGNCQYHSGNYEARKCVQGVRRILSELGIDEAKVEMFNVSSNQGWKIPEIVEKMEAQTRKEGKD